MAREWAGAAPRRAPVTLLFLNLLQSCLVPVGSQRLSLSEYLWLGHHHESGLILQQCLVVLSHRLPGAELVFPKPNRMHLTASKWMWPRTACITAPWRPSRAFWWPLLLSKADSRQGSIALCYPAFVMARRLQIAGVSHPICLPIGIVFFDVFIWQLHGRIVINLNNKHQWLKEVGSCLFCWDGWAQLSHLSTSQWITCPCRIEGISKGRLCNVVGRFMIKAP